MAANRPVDRTTTTDPALGPDSRIYVAGHTGMVGSAVVRRLEGLGYRSVVRRRHDRLDLTDQRATRKFFAGESLDAVVMAAARVGGIAANLGRPTEFIRDNLAIALNVIHEAWRAGVPRLLFLGSSCIYPRDAPQPIPESALLSGPLEPSNEPYAIAKIAGLKLCEALAREHGADYRSLMPTNLYGPGDNFHPEDSHVVPALLRRFHEARERGAASVTVWGSGSARREFLHVDDLAAACVHVLTLPRVRFAAVTTPAVPHVNVGTGSDLTIRELAELIGDVVGYRGTIVFDPSRPEGTPRKLLDVSRIQQLGWQPKIGLRNGLEQTYRWYTQKSGSE